MIDKEYKVWSFIAEIVSIIYFFLSISSSNSSLIGTFNVWLGIYSELYSMVEIQK